MNKFSDTLSYGLTKAKLPIIYVGVKDKYLCFILEPV